MDTNTTHWTESEVLHHPSEACRALNYLADVNADLLETLEAIQKHVLGGRTESAFYRIDSPLIIVITSAVSKAKGET